MFELRVLTGLHRGAALPLSGSSWLVGSADHADLVLYDPGIKPHHCQLKRQSAESEVIWTLCALDDGSLCDAEGHSVAEIDALAPGTPFAVGRIWLCVAAADTPWQDEDPSPPQAEAAAQTEEQPTAHAEPAETPPPPAERRPLPARLPLWAKGCYVLLSLLLLAMIGSWQLQESVAMPPAPAPQDTRVVLGSQPQLAEVLRTMLRERELSGVVKLLANTDRIILTGQLTPEAQKKLERMLDQLHQRYRTALSVDNNTRLKTKQLPFQIVQVASGPRAHIVTADGRRFFVGDEIDSLRLVNIDEHQIEFSGKQQITVNW